MENIVNKENLDFYKKSLENIEYKVIDKFFRFWITRSFALHFINGTKIHKTFLNENGQFDEKKYEKVLDYLMIQDIFTKTKTIRYDNIGDFLDATYIEGIFIQDDETYKLFGESRFTEELSEFNFSDIKGTNMGDFDVLLDNNITEEEVLVVDEGLKKYLGILYNELVNLIIENRKNKDILELKNEVINNIIKIILKKTY